MIHYYLDPGQGFVFAQNTSWLWGILLGILGSLAVFFRFFFRFIKGFFLLLVILCAAAIAGGIFMHTTHHEKKVVILGVDAMDPGITEQLMRSGDLPHLAALRKQGGYSRLATTNPPESAVAWTTFSTGTGPANHGIFDFIMRYPETYAPYLSLNEVKNARGAVQVASRKKAGDFWDILSRRRIPSAIYLCPNTFPAKPLRGTLLSGMGVPDITGTMGKFTFYTTRTLIQEDSKSRGRVIHLQPAGGLASTLLYGPRTSHRGKVTESSVPLLIRISPKEKAVRIRLQGREIILKEGAWSAWHNVAFPAGTFRKVRGIVRFYCKSVSPECEVYASPVNIDPRDPQLPISYPNNFSAELARAIGPYHTQGMPYDTWALTENRLDERAFLEQADEVMKENGKMLRLALKRHKEGVLYFYIETLDVIQHMFWRYTDPRHPLHEKDPRFQDTIAAYYRKVDDLVGEVMDASGKDTVLILVSDHGFTSFRKSVNLNRWLLDHGYLTMKEGANDEKEFLEGVDWSKTKAYALGFGGIYLNRAGREYYGIVGDDKAAALQSEIAQGLRKLQDPEDGSMVVRQVYTREGIFRGRHLLEAPDLFVGFNPGFRASWLTALGATGKQQLQANDKKWSGDHLVDPELVPGVIFANRPLTGKDPSLQDIAPTVLGLYGIAEPQEMTGMILLKDAGQ